MAKSTRKLVADENLLIHTIKRQAGTLQKGILEATMNSIESGATRVDINLDTHGVPEGDPGAVLVITDDGCGIVTKEELIQHFERFGTPHEESENKIWAEFRMGRAQLFCFGANVWRTATFQMVVDIETPPALSYNLTEKLKKIKGTRIEIALYKCPCGDSMESLKAEIKKQIEFMEVPVFFNGDQINTPASKCKWTHEDADAYYLFGKGSVLEIYNLGAFVKSISASEAGLVGVVVSKKRLTLSVSRNEIIRSGNDACPVYDRIEAVIKDNRIKKVRRKANRLNRDERIATLRDLLAGDQEYNDVKGLGLFETCNGRVMSLDAIRKIRSPWCFAESGNVTADRLIESGRGICLSEDNMDWLSYSGHAEDFFDWLLRASFRNNYSGLQEKWKHIRRLHREFDDLAVDYSGKSNFIPEKDWTKLERRIIKVLQSYDYWDGRTLCIGTSDVYLAWTDGSSYICLAREYLKRLYLSYPSGAAALIHTMFHETAHDDDTSGTHIHGMEFYRAFHEITSGKHNNDYDSPLGIIADFCDQMKKAKIDETNRAAVAKEEKHRASRNKALGTDRVAARVVTMTPVKTTKIRNTIRPAVIIGADGKKVKRKRY